MERWCKAAGIEDGAIYRRVENHGCIGERTITSAEVARTFKRIAGQLGLDPGRPVSRISAHSTRIGAAQHLTAAGAALPEIMLAAMIVGPPLHLLSRPPGFYRDSAGVLCAETRISDSN